MDNYSYNQPQMQYKFGGCVPINNPQYVWEYPVAPGIVVYFVDDNARKFYKKFGVPYGQPPIEEYDMTPVVRQTPEDNAIKQMMDQLTAMRAEIDALKGEGKNEQPVV